MTRIRYEMPGDWRAYARHLGMTDAGYAQQVADRVARQWNRPVDVTDGPAGKLAASEPQGEKRADAGQREHPAAAGINRGSR